MVDHKYGKFTNDQLDEVLLKLRKKIFFLLLYVDPKTRHEYENIDVLGAFDNILYELGGMNSILFAPPHLITVISLLEEARLEYLNEDFNFPKYRKLILDSGVEILRIGGV